MKVALLSESPADEAALRVLVEAVLAESFTLVRPGLRARGWPNVAQVLPAVLRHLHFNTETEALVVVVDSDDSVVHTAEHEAPGYFHPHCRLCQLRSIFHRTQRRFPALHGRDRVLRGVGIAVPAIEAWYLCGQDPQVTELAWMEGQARGGRPTRGAISNGGYTARTGRAWASRSSGRWNACAGISAIRAGSRRISRMALAPWRAICAAGGGTDPRAAESSRLGPPGRAQSPRLKGRGVSVITLRSRLPMGSPQNSSRSLVCLLVAQTQVVLNDNAAKLMLIGLAQFPGILDADDVAVVISLLPVLMITPFILLSPLAGWMCDRYSKKRMVQASLLLQTGILLALTLSLRLHHIWLVLAFFSPVRRSGQPVFAGETRHSQGAGRLGAPLAGGGLDGDAHGGRHPARQLRGRAAVRRQDRAGWGRPGAPPSMWAGS